MYRQNRISRLSTVVMLLTPSQIVAIVCGGTLGIVGILGVLHDAWVIFKRDTPPAHAYAVSAIIGAVTYVAFVVLLAIHGAPMPAFAGVFPLYSAVSIMMWYKQSPKWHTFTFLAAFALYWNVAILENSTVIASATPLLIVHHGPVTLFLRPRTHPL